MKPLLYRNPFHDKKMRDKNMKTRSPFFCLQSFCRLLITAILLASLAALHAADAAKQKPNLVIIFTDDMGYADIGAYGCKDIPTPHLDRSPPRALGSPAPIPSPRSAFLRAWAS
jgi:hypothetical protein